MENQQNEAKTEQLARTLDRLIVALMLMITATLAWPVALILWTSGFRV